MKENKHVNLKICCPCYKHNNGMAIYCLGAAGASSTITTFSNTADRKRYMKKHCSPTENSKRCALYSVLLKENGGF